jgi:hypothetical protein
LAVLAVNAYALAATRGRASMTARFGARQLLHGEKFGETFNNQ